MAREGRQWTKEDRKLLCLILKKIGFKFENCETAEEYSNLKRKHSQLYEKAAQIMTVIFGETFSDSQLELQVNKTNMYRFRETGQINDSALQMTGCMIDTGLIDAEGFKNLHHTYFDLLHIKKQEDQILKKAEEIIERKKSNNNFNLDKEIASIDDFINGDKT